MAQTPERNVSRQTGIDAQQLPEGTAAPVQSGFKVKCYHRNCTTGRPKPAGSVPGCQSVVRITIDALVIFADQLM